MDVIFEPMREGDLDAVMSIERASFSAPWPRSTYAQELRRERLSAYWVIRSLPATGAAPDVQGAPPHAPPILAYGGYWLLDGEAHITTIAVHSAWRRRGLARGLLVRMLGEARKAGVTAATLEVRAGNVVAARLYESLGFEEVGVRRGYYRDNHEDARLLTLHGLDHEVIWRRLKVAAGK